MKTNQLWLRAMLLALVVACLVAWASAPVRSFDPVMFHVKLDG